MDQEHPGDPVVADPVLGEGHGGDAPTGTIVPVKHRGNTLWKPGQSASPRHQWKPGQSGNPKGKGLEKEAVRREFRTWARNKVDKKGRIELLKLAQTAAKEETRLAAWRLLAEYGYGKPVETVEIPTPIRLLVARMGEDGEPDY